MAKDQRIGPSFAAKRQEVRKFFLLGCQEFTDEFNILKSSAAHIDGPQKIAFEQDWQVQVVLSSNEENKYISVDFFDCKNVSPAVAFAENGRIELGGKMSESRLYLVIPVESNRDEVVNLLTKNLQEPTYMSSLQTETELNDALRMFREHRYHGKRFTALAREKTTNENEVESHRVRLTQQYSDVVSIISFPERHRRK